jgi:N6-adenosine-specific RNA methylase IME4
MHRRPVCTSPSRCLHARSRPPAQAICVTETAPEPPTGRIVADARDTLARIPTGSAGLIITDPPWDLHATGLFDACASYERLSIETIAAILADGRRALVKGGHLYCFATAGPEIVRIITSFESYGWKCLRILAWDKCIHSGMGAYRNSWEPVIIFSNGRPRRYEKHQTYPSILRARSIGRRTAKPWELYEVFMEMSSKPGELVVDPFCGTNPLETAATRLQPLRRWLAGDLLTPEQVAYQVQHRTRRSGEWRTQLASLAQEAPPSPTAPAPVGDEPPPPPPPSPPTPPHTGCDAPPPPAGGAPASGCLV